MKQKIDIVFLRILLILLFVVGMLISAAGHKLSSGIIFIFIVIIAVTSAIARDKEKAKK